MGKSIFNAPLLAVIKPDTTNPDKWVLTIYRLWKGLRMFNSSTVWKSKEQCINKAREKGCKEFEYPDESQTL